MKKTKSLSESIICTLVENLTCIQSEQLYEIMRSFGREKEQTDYAIHGAVFRENIIREGEDIYNCFYKTDIDQIIDLNIIDAIWAMLEHIKDEEDKMEIIQYATAAEIPAQLCYFKNDIVYYVMKVSSESEVGKLILLNEKLVTKCDKAERNIIRIIVLVDDETIKEKLPATDFETMVLKITHQDAMKKDRPQIEPLS